LEQNGQMAYPVHEIVMAWDTQYSLSGLDAVGADTTNVGAKTLGSILVNRMKVVSL